MSSRKDSIRKSFAAAMRKQEQANHSTSFTPQHTEPSDGSWLSRPLPDKLEEAKTNLLKEVGTHLVAVRPIRCFNPEPVVLQDFDKLRKGFIKLNDKYTKSNGTISALKDQLNTCLSESEQLRVQVSMLQDESKVQIATLQESKVQISTLQEELRVRTETMANREATLTSALRVRTNALKPPFQ